MVVAVVPLRERDSREHRYDREESNELSHALSALVDEFLEG
jgi:hypothetical protein